ncbi:MAG: PAS domain-containing protein, partial [Ignavibacteria bacterium]|nr:PAS domain-containing protein [Ignavibacteria bacterium]
MGKLKIVKQEPDLKKSDGFVVPEHKQKFAIDFVKISDRGIKHNKNNILDRPNGLISQQDNPNPNTSGTISIDFFEQPMIGFAVLDGFSKIKKVNKKLCDILGYEPSELIGKKSYNFLKTSSLKKEIKEFNEFILTGKTTQIFEKPLMRKDGCIVYVEISGKSFLNDDGSILYLVSVWDISQRKFLESNLLNSEFYDNTLINVTPDVVTIINSQGIIIECNNILSKKLGKPKEELIG